jgi:hypothetical protein
MVLGPVMGPNQNKCRHYMKKFAEQIENDMAFMLCGTLRQSIQFENAIAHLDKASNLLKNAGFDDDSEFIQTIKKATLNGEYVDVEIVDDLRQLLEMK